jgi:two-component system sensor histidine kinase RstB
VRFRLEQLAATDDPAARVRIRDALERDLEQVESLLTELLVYARADVEPITLAEGPWDLGSWLVDVIDAADTLREGVDVTLHVEPGLPTPAVTRAHLARIVGNLIRNAQRHARAQVEVRMTRDGPQHVALAVEDDGPGLPVGDRARLVQPFETGGAPSDAPALPMGARSPSTGANPPAAGAGVGLGLAIVSRIVERAGGTLTLDDAASGGARIVVRLPVRGA